MLARLYNQLRLFATRRKEPYLLYHRLLGFYPNDLTLYELAFVHKSSSIQRADGKWVNNERLEFLGDAILDAIVAEILFHHFEQKKEGFLTNTRSKIVSREMLNTIALGLGLEAFIVVSDRTRTQNSSIFGNALEALIGAIYLDMGYRATRKFVEEKMLAPYVDLSVVAQTEVNFKSKMIEWAQKFKLSVTFELLESVIQSNNQSTFHTQISLAGIEAGVGTGGTKKESQQRAAQITLEKLKSDQPLKRRILAAAKESSFQVSETVREAAVETSGDYPSNEQI